MPLEGVVLFLKFPKVALGQPLILNPKGGVTESLP